MELATAIFRFQQIPTKTLRKKQRPSSATGRFQSTPRWISTYKRVNNLPRVAFNSYQSCSN